MHLCQLYHNKIEGKKELRQLANLLDLIKEKQASGMISFDLG